MITVTGIASESTDPDQTELSLTLNVKNEDYNTMMTEASEKSEALILALTNVGFPRPDIKTAEFNIGTDYDNVQTDNGTWKRQFTGYRLTHRLHLAFPYDMKALNNALNAVSSCNDISPELHILFTVKDKEEINRRLLAAAVKDARTKAEIIASAAGVTLGEICEITYGTPDPNHPSPTLYRQTSELCRGTDMNINPEEAESVVEVSAAWYVGK